MINKIFKKPSDKIDFIISESEYYRIGKALSPEHSGKFLPDWYKDLNNSYQTTNEYNLTYNRPTVKSCSGIKTTLTNGFIIPMWSDLIVDIFPDKSISFQYSYSNAAAMIHHRVQYGNLYTDCTHLKLLNPWAAKTNRSKLFYLTSPFYHINSMLDYSICPGFLDLYYSHSLNINLFFKVKQEKYRVIIPVGFPIAQLISTDDSIFQISTKPVSKDIFEGLAGERDISFYKSDRKLIKFIKGRWGG